ncbi:MAG: MATE family efflux transporter [Clostridiales bacterium]|nr:MATE family efflux transporter [Clostridiales bacterium]
MQQERSRMLGEMPMKKLVPTIAVPIMISMLVQALYNIVDSYFVAQYSATALSAVNLAYPLQMLMIALSTGMGTGVNSVISRRLGEKNGPEARRAAMNGLFVEGCGWLLFVVVGLFVSRPFIAAFTDDAQLIAEGSDYLTIVCTCSVGLFGAITMERMLQASGNTMASMITQLAGALVNIALDPVFIFVFDMGVVGAAVATVIGQIASFLLGFVLNQKFNAELRLRWDHFRPDLRIIRSIFVVGFPATVAQAISFVLNVAMNALLMGFSTAAMNVLGVYFKLQSFIFMPVFGLTNGMVPIVGYNYGARSRKRVYECVKVSLAWAMTIMFLGMVLFLAAPEFLMGLFDKGSEAAADLADEAKFGSMVQIGSVALRVISSHFLLAAAGITLSTVFQAVGKGNYSLIMSLCRQIVVLLPAAWLLSKISLNAVWWAFLIAEAASLTICLILFVRCDRKLLRPLDAQNS